MASRITPGQIKRNNRKLIYDYIYQNKRVSQQDIAYALRLSRPTVAASLTEMEEDGLVFRDGQVDSDQIGRKAVAYTIADQHRIAIGVELMRKVVKIIAVTLYGEVIMREVYTILFEKTEKYYKTVCDTIMEFITKNDFQDEQILGVGFAMQGLVTADGKKVLYGVILDCTGLTTDVFARYLKYPCLFVHDPEGAAFSELWVSPELNDAIYLSLSRHLGGALIADRQVRSGKHGHNTTFEHIQMKPRGKLCYCGKRGCMETLLSMKELMGEREPEDFFRAVRSGEAEEAAQWAEYLQNLGRLISIIHLVNDVDIILGGHLSAYLLPEDVEVLYREVNQLVPFEEKNDYLLISKMPRHSITVGTALPFVREFLDHVGHEAGM